MSAKQWITIGTGAVVLFGAVVTLAVEGSPPKTTASSVATPPTQTLPPAVQAEPLASVAKLSPRVTKKSGSVQFSVSLPADVKPQRVEFYVESNLVAAVYAAPYVASVPENSLATGNHRVVAKIYTSDSNVQTQAMPFQSSASAQTDTSASIVKPAATSDIAAASSSQPTTQTTTALSTPVDVSASQASDGSIMLTWNPVDGATSYQIWRDGIQQDVTSTGTYSDVNVVPGKSYAYTVIAVDAAGNTSAASDPTTVMTTDDSAKNNVVAPAPSDTSDGTDEQPASV